MFVCCIFDSSISFQETLQKITLLWMLCISCSNSNVWPGSFNFVSNLQIQYYHWPLQTVSYLREAKEKNATGLREEFTLAVVPLTPLSGQKPRCILGGNVLPPWASKREAGAGNPIVGASVSLDPGYYQAISIYRTSILRHRNTRISAMTWNGSVSLCLHIGGVFSRVKWF